MQKWLLFIAELVFIRISSSDPTSSNDGYACKCLATDASRQVSSECYVTVGRQITSNWSADPLPITDANIFVQPRGRGFSVNWTTAASFKPGSFQGSALFVFERHLPTKNECLAISFSSSWLNQVNEGSRIRVSLTCNESVPLTNVQYAVSLHNLPRLVLAETVKPPHSYQVLVPSVEGELDTLWMTTVVLRTDRTNCSTNSDVRLSFTLPENKEYPGYQVKLCVNTDCEQPHTDDKELTTQNNSASFYDVKPGIYYIWVSPDDFEYGNSARGVSFTLLPEPEPAWNSDLSAASACGLTPSGCCVEISFKPAENTLRFREYTTTIFANEKNGTKEVVTLLTTNFTAARSQERSLHLECNITSGSYIVTVSPQGECPLWAQPQRTTVLLRDAPSSATVDIVTISVPTIAVISILVVIILLARRKMVSKTARLSMPLSCLLRRSSSSRDDRDQASGQEGAVFGGMTPAVLLLYAHDHETHGKVVKAFAELLKTYGGFNVTLDQWCDPEAILRNDWLGKQISDADFVIIIVSEGVSLIHESFLRCQVFPKYAKEYPSYFEISEVLSLSAKLPALRKKLIQVTTEYSRSTSIVTDWLLPQFGIPLQLNELVCFLYGASSASEWSCKDQCLQSPEYKSMTTGIRKMADFARRKPSYFLRTYGPPEDKLDSGIEQQSSRLWQGGSFRGSIGGTEVITLCNINSLVPDHGYSSATDSMLVGTATALSTDMPRIEEIWRQYASRQSSVDDSFFSPELYDQTMQRLDSISLRTVFEAGECAVTGETEDVRFICDGSAAARP